MIRVLFGTVLWGCLAAVAGIGLFFIKHEVKDLESQLGSLNRDIRSHQEAVHVLKAEWSYLNDPARLRALSERHLGMHPVAPSQIASLDQVLHGSALARALPPEQPAPAVAEARPQPAKPQPQPPAAAPVKSPPQAAKPPPALAKAAPPPAPAPAPDLPPKPAGKVIVIQSPALAQSEYGGGR